MRALGLTLTPSGTVNDGNGGNNYTYTFVPESTGVITAQALTITAVANTKVYDGTTSAAAVPTITSGSLATGDTADFTETYSTRNVGTGLTLTPSGTVNDGNGGNNYTYTFVPESTGVITPAPLVVRANSASIVYGSALPALSDTISGFVGGDNSSVVSGAPVLSTTAASGANAGAYPITVAAGTLSATNYTFPAADLIAGTLTVTPAPLVITAVSTTILGRPALAHAHGDLRGIRQRQHAGESQPRRRSFTRPRPPSAVPGSYPITVSGASSPNYTITYVPGTLTVILSPATVESVSIQKIKVSKHKSVQGIVLQFSEALNSADAQNINVVHPGHGPEEQEAEEQAGAAIQSDLQLLGVHGDALHEKDAGA